MNAKILSLIAIVSITMGMASQPVNAQGWHHGRGNNPNSTVLITQIDQRIAAVENEIAAARQSGRISRGQAQMLSHSVRRASKLRDRAMRHGLDNTAIAQINLSLDDVRARLQSSIASAPGLAVVQSSTFASTSANFGAIPGVSGAWGSGGFASRSGISLGLSGNVADRIVTLRARVNEARERGLISGSETRNLQDQVNQVDRNQQRLTRHGQFSPNEQNLASGQLDQINVQLTNTITANSRR